MEDYLTPREIETEKLRGEAKARDRQYKLMRRQRDRLFALMQRLIDAYDVGVKYETEALLYGEARELCDTIEFDEEQAEPAPKVSKDLQSAFLRHFIDEPTTHLQLRGGVLHQQFVRTTREPGEPEQVERVWKPVTEGAR